MRRDAGTKLKIVLIEDSEVSKDPVRKLINDASLNPGSDVEPVRSLMHGENHLTGQA
jgi:hypothetical protein